MILALYQFQYQTLHGVACDLFMDIIKLFLVIVKIVLTCIKVVA